MTTGTLLKTKFTAKITKKYERFKAKRKAKSKINREKSVKLKVNTTKSNRKIQPPPPPPLSSIVNLIPPQISPTKKQQ